MKARITGIAIGVLMLGTLAGAIGATPALASAKAAPAVTPKATVIGCTANRSTVVLLTATSNLPQPRFLWDLNGDGVFDTPLNTSGGLIERFRPTSSGTARVAVQASGGGSQATASLTIKLGC